jgi:hypothetical protein
MMPERPTTTALNWLAGAPGMQLVVTLAPLTR